MRVVHHKPQRSTGTERGLRSWGMCRSIPAAYHAQGRSHVRPVGSGTVPRCLCDDLPVDLGGSLNRCRHFFQFRTQPSRQSIPCVLPCHFQISVSVADQPSDGVNGDAPNLWGELPKNEGERQDVVS